MQRTVWRVELSPLGMWEGSAASAAQEPNGNNIAPLDRNAIKTIAVIGPNANRGLQGGYSGAPKHNVTVLAIGGNEQTSREAWSRQHMGDRTSLDLIGRQEELVKAMAALCKPVIIFLFNGRPLSINYVAENVPVIYECWYLGQETGRAVADVLFGDYNPGGKLPISAPRSAGHLPVFYNYKPSARRGYLFDDVSPLYAFGYGLSYTSFTIENPRLTKKKIRPDGSTQLLVDVTNMGQRAGAEVVQLYIRDLVSSVTRPVKDLKGFQKVWLKPGERATVTLDITPASLSFYDINMKYAV